MEMQLCLPSNPTSTRRMLDLTPNTTRHIVRDWSDKGLPSTFTRSYTYIITELRLLVARMSEFIDQLTKATAQHLAKAYLNSPHNTYIDIDQEEAGPPDPINFPDQGHN
ncbi:hypothetical protein IL306_012789 [Fusarium sp. DS 682]|nr:hypothetical protein IL306_012789 [Fusarium sp. DS 682]